MMEYYDDRDKNGIIPSWFAYWPMFICMSVMAFYGYTVYAVIYLINIIFLSLSRDMLTEIYNLANKTIRTKNESSN